MSVMRFPSKEQIAALQRQYPRGTRVELLGMDDPQAPPTGAMDEILGVGWGFHAAVYEMVETPEETGLGDIECRLNLVEACAELFEDGGHAMAWCMKRI